MQLDLPEPISRALAPLWAALPADRALARLVVSGAPDPGHVALVEQALATPALSGREDLAAGLWLYIDDLDRSHRISQRHEDNPTFCYWHAIMHRLEGDFSNSEYWLGRTGEHPAMGLAALVTTAAGGGKGYSARGLVRDARAAHAKGQTPAEIVLLQRLEWATLLTWCAR